MQAQGTKTTAKKGLASFMGITGGETKKSGGAARGWPGAALIRNAQGEEHCRRRMGSATATGQSKVTFRGQKQAQGEDWERAVERQTG